MLFYIVLDNDHFSTPCTLSHLCVMSAGTAKEWDHSRRHFCAIMSLRRCMQLLCISTMNIKCMIFSYLVFLDCWRQYTSKNASWRRCCLRYLNLLWVETLRIESSAGYSAYQSNFRKNTWSPRQVMRQSGILHSLQIVYRFKHSFDSGTLSC